MRKNKMMRLASALLVAVLLTTCAISGTFAKYVAEDSATDTARVAKWGVKVEVTGDDTFAKMYTDAVTTDASAATVLATTEVVAPGTEGKFGAITVTGSPEVDVEVEVVATLTLSDDWTVKVAGVDTFYCPLVIAGVNGVNYLGDKDGYIKAILTAISGDDSGSKTTYVDAGTALDTTFDKDLAWNWAYSTDAAHDVYDTELGDKATLPTVEFSIKVTVTQVN